MKYDVWTPDGNTKRGEVRLPQTFWSRLLDQRDRLIEMLRQGLRQWLGIEERIVEGERIIWNRITEVWDVHGELRQKLYDETTHLADLIKTLDAGMEGLNGADANLMKLISELSANLQSQISELKNGPVASYGAHESPTEPVQMHAGHVRFSYRKRQYEAEHRRPISTEAGKQIAENARIIASGTRKTDDKS